MATTSRGDDAELRRTILAGLARRIVQQRTDAGPPARPVPLRARQRLTATPAPRSRGAKA